MSSNSRTNHRSSQSLTLAVLHNQRQLMTVDLEPSNSVFVGSGSNCRIILQDKSVKQIHCMIWQDADGSLFVQDWNTETTLVNGTPINSEYRLGPSDKLTIGNYQINWQFSDGHSDPEEETEVAVDLMAPESEIAVFEEESSEPDVDLALDMLKQEARSESMPVWEPQEPAASAAPSSTNQAFVADDNDDWSNDLPDFETTASPARHGTDNVYRYQIDADAEDDADLQSMLDPFSVSHSPFGHPSPDDNDDAELLRMEIEQLRYELSERDLQLQSVRDKQQSRDSNESGDSGLDGDGQTLKLVARLEELLAELDASDERVRNMEELLRLSDQATRAEQEERQQLESWVSEIESRVQHREAESEAEKSRLTAQLKQAHEQINRSQQHIKQLLQTQNDQASTETSAQVDRQHQELLQQFQAQVEELRDQLHQVNQENEQLRQRPEPIDDEDGNPQEDARQLRQQLVEMQVEMSRERANTARQHAELERIRDELESRIRSLEGLSDGDSKLIAVSQQLRSLQKEKQAEVDDIRKRSLGGRIASLLTRVR